jgi:hypothetical protein
MQPTTSGAGDFDFLIGHWNVTHRRLKERLVGNEEWVAFSGSTAVRKVLGGYGNIDDNELDLPGDPYRAITLRAFDVSSGEWSIWWLDGRKPSASLEPPVRGRFKDGVGTFYADDVLNGTSIRVRFIWSNITPASCRWQQAFSADNGSTWETNWTMDFKRDSQ